MGGLVLLKRVYLASNTHSGTIVTRIILILTDFDTNLVFYGGFSFDSCELSFVEINIEKVPCAG